MPRNDREVWDLVVSDSHGNSNLRELDYITYAIYSFEKFEWYEQIERQKNQPPSAAEINDWISQITATRVKGWREAAARTFDEAARTYQKDEFERNRQAIIDSSVVKEVKGISDSVRKSTSFGAALFSSFLTAILTPIILGLIIVGIRAFDLWPTPAQVEEFFYREKGKTETSPQTGQAAQPRQSLPGAQTGSGGSGGSGSAGQ
jgi:hypothetical protein